MRDTRLISWIKAARKEFEEFPEDVQSDIFDALTLAAEGGKSDKAKPFKGVDGGVFEIALRYRGDAFRALYAVKIGADIWVIQAFQKKSKSGIQNAANGGRSYPGTAQAIEGGFEMKNDDMELVRGSGNVYRDFGRPNAGLEQARAIIAAKIINILDERKLSTRDAEKLTGVSHSEFSRIRNAKLRRFTLDRMISVLGKLDEDVEVNVTFSPRQHSAHAAPYVR